MNQLRTIVSFVKIVGEIGKSSCKHGREQKIGLTQYPLSREQPLWLSQKPTGDGLPGTVRKPCTNYTNVMFAYKCSQVYMGSSTEIAAIK